MSETEIRQRIGPALNLLLDSFRYARALESNVWEFAVEIDRLQAEGTSNSDLRYIISVGYAEHAVEVTPLKSRKRVFRKLQNLAFAGRTCFVLTESGESFVRLLGLIQPNSREGWKREDDRASEADIEQPIVPKWLRDRRELRLGDRVVKQFKVPAPNQETILAAFEEEGWPYRIDDPLPPHMDQDPKRRLHDTINKLNRHQRHTLVHFRGDGTGRGICWEPRSCSAPNGNGGATTLPVLPLSH